MTKTTQSELAKAQIHRELARLYKNLDKADKVLRQTHEAVKIARERLSTAFNEHEKIVTQITEHRQTLEDYDIHN